MSRCDTVSVSLPGCLSSGRRRGRGSNIANDTLNELSSLGSRAISVVGQVSSRDDKLIIADIITSVAEDFSVTSIDVLECIRLERITKGNSSLQGRNTSVTTNLALIHKRHSTHINHALANVDQCTMDLLSTLRVPTKNNLGTGTCRFDLLDVFGHESGTLG